MQRSSLLAFLGTLAGVLAFSSVAAIASTFWKPPARTGARVEDVEENESDDRRARARQRRPRIRQVQTTFLGVSTETDDGRLVVTDVTGGTAAEEAGVEEGDVLLAIGDREVSTPNELGDAIRAHKPGEQVVLHVRRGSETLELDATLRMRTSDEPVLGEPYPGGTLRGVVTHAESGDPLTGVEVKTIVVSLRRHSTGDPVRETTRTGADGTYELKIPASQDPLEIEFSLPRYRPWRRPLEESGDATLDAQLAPDRRPVLSGHIRARGVAVPPSVVTLRFEKRGFLGVESIDLRNTTPLGPYEFPLDPGSWTVSATAEDGLASPEHVVKLGAENVTLDLELAPAAERR